MDRIETDLLGSRTIPDDVYWGIHTLRATENFGISGRRISPVMIKAYAKVKKACALANAELGYIDSGKAEAVIQACNEIAEGGLEDHFPVDVYQGGAGTSTNMNINEVIANRALEILGHKKSSYDIIHPLETVNLHQSTNDTYPTAVKIAVLFALRELSEEISKLQGSMQAKENEFADIITIGRTEMQDAVPMTLGAQFASFADAVARDRWRVFKCEERIRMLNIGGTAIGSGLTAPRKYIFKVIEILRNLTGLPISRAENPIENTANTDAFVEISGMLDANASNLIKIANDLRTLHFLNEIELPAVQAGSSIMPGKINPVIIESVLSGAMRVSNNHTLIARCTAQGSLQINEFMPLIAASILESLEILLGLNRIMANHIKDIKANRITCMEHFNNNQVIITAFLPHIGYERATEIVKGYNSSSGKTFRDYLTEHLGRELVDKTLNPQSLMALGYK